MSKYTTEVRFICETNAGLSESQGYNNVKDIIANSRAKIFDFDYPIFDEAYRPTLETKILKHYYTREIGLETVGLWKHFLDMRMNEIMPYYNKLYQSELIEFNPLYDVDYTREGTREENQDRTENDSRTDTMTGTITDAGTGTNKMTGTVADVGTGSEVMTGTVKDDGTSEDTMTGTVTDAMTGTVRDNGTTTSQDGGSETRNGSSTPKKSTWDLYSDTPQGGITGIEGAVPSGDNSLTDNSYLTNARHIIEDGTGSTEATTLNFGKTVNGTSDTTRTYNTENERTYDTEENGETHQTRTHNTDKRTTDNNTKTYNTDNDTTNDNVRTFDTQNESEGNKVGNTATEGNYFERIKGKMGNRSYAKMIQELRETFLNIDMMIINDLSDLFLNIY